MSRTAAASRRLTMRSVSRHIRCQCSMRKPTLPRTTLLHAISMRGRASGSLYIRQLILKVTGDSHFFHAIYTFARRLFFVRDRSVLPPFLKRWLG